MPRNHNAGPSTLRNRNRVTNKTRLKVIKESIDADPIVLDEDEEKARVVSTAGVDAEDANEHHLQAVLSAAASRHQAARSRTSTGESSAAAAAYIPTPGSTGVVENYSDLYPSERWRDPHTYVKTSDTVEEAIADALTNGFIYYMDERDKEWLDKNNEEARGEGTSAQGAVLSTTRSGRNARKGKEPVEGPQAIAMTEDEFELVMALFEKVTHEKTPFLHHGLEQGSALFPPFTEYQDVFATDLHPTMFALPVLPDWIPPPPQLSKYARAVYTHWSRRRQERGGHPIIPIVNLDETDTRNESYICFRRREIKAVRKTRAQQATYGDKMQRLQSEMLSAIDIAKLVVQRESVKKEAASYGLAQADCRFRLADLKRKFPALGTKEDEELYYDKERAPKKARVDSSGRIPLKTRSGGNGEYSSLHQDRIMHPQDRCNMVQKQVDDEMARRKEKDHHWEDAVDNPFQPTPTTLGARHWRTIVEAQQSKKAAGPSSPSRPRAARLRYGRGGRIHVDRHLFSSRFISPSSDSEDDEARERHVRLQSQWRYDEDDTPAVGFKGAEEQHRQLVDDWDLKYLPYQMTLLNEVDHHTLSTDSSLTILNSEGRPQQYTPFKLGAPSRREQMAAQRSLAAPSPNSGTQSASVTPRQPNGAPVAIPLTPTGAAVSMPIQVKNMQSSMPPPNGVRVPSGGPRPPSTPVPSTASPSVPSQVPPVADVSQSPTHATFSDPKLIALSLPKPNAVLNSQNDVTVQTSAPVELVPTPSPTTVSPSRPKSQNQHLSMPMASQFQFPVNNFPHIPSSPYVHPAIRGPNALSATQQMQAMKTPFANTSPLHELTAQAQQHLRTPVSYMTAHTATNGANYPAQLAAARQMQWVAAVAAQQQQQAQMQRSPSVAVLDANGIDASMAAMLSPSPLLNNSPTRVQSSNGNRTLSVKPGLPLPSPSLAHTMTAQGRASPANIARLTPHGQASPPHLVSPSLAAAQAAQTSPSRAPQAALASPSLQTRQAVGGSGAVGY